MLRLQDILEFLWAGSGYSLWKMLLILGAAVLMIVLVVWMALT